MKQFIAFQCERCKGLAVMTGITADEDDTLYLDTRCPTCKTANVIKTSAEQLRSLRSDQSIEAYEQPAYLM